MNRIKNPIVLSVLSNEIDPNEWRAQGCIQLDEHIEPSTLNTTKDAVDSLMTFIFTNNRPARRNVLGDFYETH